MGKCRLIGMLYSLNGWDGRRIEMHAELALLFIYNHPYTLPMTVSNVYHHVAYFETEGVGVLITLSNAHLVVHHFVLEESTTKARRRSMKKHY